jgi:hypothetical protein
VVDYPIQDLEKMSRRIQELLGDFRNKQSVANLYDFSSRNLRELWDASTKVMYQASDDFMNQASVEIFPQLHKVLGEIEVSLSIEDQSIRERIYNMHNGLS